MRIEVKDVDKLNTVKKIISYVKPKIDLYRSFPEKEEDIIQSLTIIFDINSECWPRIIKDGVFVESFKKDMGKARMTALEKLLYKLDEQHYKRIMFIND